MSQSPSSVDDMCSSWPQHMTEDRQKNSYLPSHCNISWSLWGGEGSDDESEQLSEAWNIPTKGEMNRRLDLRRRIREETLLNRRIHRHGGIVGGRNLALVLQQREIYGSMGGASVHHRHHRSRDYQLPKNVGCPSQLSSSPKQNNSNIIDPLNGSQTGSSSSRAGHRSNSPPNSTTTTGSSSSRNRRSLTTTPLAGSLTQEIRTFSEYCSAVRYHSAFLTHLGGQDDILLNGQRPASSQAVSTISVAFSPDAKTMASTHGDHTIKITTCGSGHLLETLIGHPRTPWTVKYHPINPNIVASGCLGHQVRLWNWTTGTCLHMIRLEYAIISLSFHPRGEVIAIANGSRLHFWSMEGLMDPATLPNAKQVGSTTPHQVTPESISSSSHQQQVPLQRRGTLIEIEQRHMLRCVHFPPDGKSVIVGGVNQTTDRTSRRPSQMSFYLRLFDFDLNAARRPHELSRTTDIISNPKTFVDRALLYNDGGFDVSPDGKTLCCCAEYWLPDGINNVMDAVYPDERDESFVDSEEEEDDDNSETDVGTDNVERQNRSPTGDSLAEHATQGNLPTLDSPPRVGNESSGESMVLASSSLPVNRTFPLTPQTPPPSVILPSSALSPPSPPGRRFAGGLTRRAQPEHHSSQHGVSRNHGSEQSMQSRQGTSNARLISGSTFLPHPPQSEIQRRGFATEALYVLARTLDGSSGTNGRFVPHVVTISLDTGLPDEEVNVNGESRRGQSGVLRSPYRRPRLGQLLEACPLDGAKASAVTCVKFSPSTDFCLIGYGVREPLLEYNGNQYHPVTSLYRIRGGMAHISTMLSSDDDVNIARFHPESGYGFVYGTKQGRVRVQSPRPWNFYNS